MFSVALWAKIIKSSSVATSSALNDWMSSSLLPSTMVALLVFSPTNGQVTSTDLSSWYERSDENAPGLLRVNQAINGSFE